MEPSEGTRIRRLKPRAPEALPVNEPSLQELPGHIPTWLDVALKHYHGTNAMKIFQWIADRLSEGTTWGAAALLVAIGLNMDEANAIVAALVAIVAAVRVFLPEKPKAPEVTEG